MNSAQLISVCIPIFNRKKKFITLLNSIDYFNNIEVIIVDDGSTDGIKSLLKKYSFNFKIKLYLNFRNRGKCSSLADSIKYSSGHYIVIMDSDDYFLPGAIKKMQY